MCRYHTEELCRKWHSQPSWPLPPSPQDIQLQIPVSHLLLAPQKTSTLCTHGWRDGTSSLVPGPSFPFHPWANPQLLAAGAEKHASTEQLLFCFLESRLLCCDRLGNSQLWPENWGLPPFPVADSSLTWINGRENQHCRQMVSTCAGALPALLSPTEAYSPSLWHPLSG